MAFVIKELSQEEKEQYIPEAVRSRMSSDHMVIDDERDAYMYYSQAFDRGRVLVYTLHWKDSDVHIYIESETLKEEKVQYVTADNKTRNKFVTDAAMKFYQIKIPEKMYDQIFVIKQLAKEAVIAVGWLFRPDLTGEITIENLDHVDIIAQETNQPICTTGA